VAKKEYPKLRDLFTEVARSGVECSLLVNPFNWQIIKNATPHGNGEPVLLLPGLAAHDVHMTLLHKFLTDKGYTTYKWDNGINTGPNEQTVKHLADRLNDIHEEHDEKVKIIGHSLGGVYARELARAYPDKVQQAITLGSPFGIGNDIEMVRPLVKKLFDFLNPKSEVLNPGENPEQMLIPPPVPTTSVYSRSDGVVHWKASINPAHKKAENIEAYASHIGLIANPVSFLIIGDRLSKCCKTWKPFDKDDYPHFSFIFRYKEAHEDYIPDMPKPPKGGHNLIFKP
jgi:hypothetical protein